MCCKIKKFFCAVILISWVIFCGCSKPVGFSQKLHGTLFKDILQSDIISHPAVALTGNEQIDRNGIIQTFNTKLTFFVKVPELAYLNFRFDQQGEGFGGEISIHSDSGNSFSKRYVESGEYQIDLSSFSGEFVEFALTLLRPEKDHRSGSKGVWSELKVFTQKSSGVALREKKIQVSQAEYKTILEKIGDYDVVYLLFDAYSAKHSSSYGYKRKTSPFFDELAQNNVLFDNMYAVAPYTLASTASLFTSTYIGTHALLKRENTLNKEVKTIAEILGANNILSYLISGHGFVGASDWGLNRGFSKVFFNRKYRTHSSEVIKTLSEIYQSGSRKFIYIHLSTPHSPYLPPQEFRVFNENSHGEPSVTDEVLRKQNANEMVNDFNAEQLKYAENMYDSNVLFADSILQDIYSYLKEHKKMKQTILIVTADHGEAFNEHGKTGHWSTLYEEMVHIPFLMVFPDNDYVPDRNVKQLASLVDVAPTITDIFGLKQPSYFRGKSLLPQIFRDSEATKTIYLEAPLDGLKCVRYGQFKLIENRKGLELYDLENDPEENNNIVAKRPIIAGWLQQQMSKVEKGRRIRSFNANQN